MDIWAKVKGIAALLILLVAGLVVGPVAAQDLSGLARLLPEESRIEAGARGVEIDLAISQPVPWRVRVMDQPPRLVMDFREVD